MNSAVSDGSCTSRYYYGIKIAFKSEGKFGVIDPLFIIVALGATLVYIAAPILIVNALAVYFLGALSDVYWKAGKEEVFLFKQLAGFVSRMITVQSSYAAVTGGDATPLTKEM